jgi:hypothetical protein
LEPPPESGRNTHPLAPKTPKKLEEISAKAREHGTNLEPMQLAALLLEKTTEGLRAEDGLPVEPPAAQPAAACLERAVGPADLHPNSTDPSKNCQRKKRPFRLSQ